MTLQFLHQVKVCKYDHEHHIGTIFFCHLLSMEHEKHLSLLQESLSSGRVLMINLKGAKRKIFTAVNSIYDNYFVIKGRDVYGQPMHQVLIPFSDIESIRRARGRYGDPVYVKVREIKDNVLQIRERMAKVNANLPGSFRQF